jgi:hypothetical protein
MIHLYTLYSILHTVSILYTPYSLYTLYSIQSVYSILHTVSILYTPYSLYTLYSIQSLYSILHTVSNLCILPLSAPGFHRQDMVKSFWSGVQSEFPKATLKASTLDAFSEELYKVCI